MTDTTKQCKSCRTERLLTTFSRDTATADHLGIICMPCEALTLAEHLDQAYQRGLDQGVNVLRAHRPGPKPAPRASRTERALQRHQEHGKRCTECHNRKPPTPDYWHPNARQVDGLQTTCRSCIALKGKLKRSVWIIARDALRAQAAAIGEPQHLSAPAVIVHLDQEHVDAISSAKCPIPHSAL
jgi:hypothetical protein